MIVASARAERALGCVSPAPQGDAVKYLSHHLDVLAQDYTEEEVWEAAIVNDKEGTMEFNNIKVTGGG